MLYIISFLMGLAARAFFTARWYARKPEDRSRMYVTYNGKEGVLDDHEVMIGE